VNKVTLALVILFGLAACAGLEQKEGTQTTETSSAAAPQPDTSVNQLETELKDLQAEINRLADSEIQELAEQKRSAQEAAQLARNQAEDLQKKLDQLSKFTEEELVALTEEREAAEKATQRANAEKLYTQKKLNELSAAAEAELQEIADQKAAAKKSSEAELKELAEQEADAKKATQQAQKEKIALQEEKELLEAQIREMSAAFILLEEKKGEASADIPSLEAQQDALLAEIDGLASRIDTLGSEHSGSLINYKQFARESAPKVDITVGAGPSIDPQGQTFKVPEKRELVSRQEPKNYMDLDELKENLFPITINLDDVDVRDAMSMLSEVTGKNILVGDEVTGTISVRLINVPWNKALDAILQIRKLAKHVNEEGTIIRIHEQEALIAQEAFERERREALIRSLEAEEAIGPMYTEIFRLYYTEPEQVKEELEAVFGLSDSQDDAGSGASAYSVEIAIDKRIKSLIIKGKRQDLDSIAQLISKIDVRTRQVLIEAFIVEATDDFSKEFGSRFGISDIGVVGNPGGTNGLTTVTSGGVAGSQPTTPGTGVGLGDLTGLATNFAVAGGAGLGVLLQSASTALKIELTAMEKQGYSKIVSNPRVFTLDNQEAVIIQGDEIPYQSATQEGGTEVQFKDAGIQLTVTPSIVGDGNIILTVTVEKKSANTSTRNPPITTRSINTKLLIKDNTVVVIGGVFTQESSDGEDKVPFLGDIPFVKHLFRYKSDKDVRKELLVFLAPRII
jgi:type IV pilus assembly protein PilQ